MTEQLVQFLHDHTFYCFLFGAMTVSWITQRYVNSRNDASRAWHMIDSFMCSAMTAVFSFSAVELIEGFPVSGLLVIGVLIGTTGFEGVKVVLDHFLYKAKILDRELRSELLNRHRRGPGADDGETDISAPRRRRAKRQEKDPDDEPVFPDNPDAGHIDDPDERPEQPRRRSRRNRRD